jgi:hypothetical protein
VERPTGVTILAVALLLGIPYLLFLALVLVGGGAFLGGIPILLMSFFSQFVDWPSHAVLLFFMQFRFAANPAVLVGFYIFFMLLHLTLGAGLLRVQNWARLVVVVLTGLNLVTAAIGFAGAHFLLFRQTILTIVIEVFVLMYLFRTEVKDAFGAARF